MKKLILLAALLASCGGADRAPAPTPAGAINLNETGSEHIDWRYITAPHGELCLVAIYYGSLNSTDHHIAFQCNTVKAQ